MYLYPLLSRQNDVIIPEWMWDILFKQVSVHEEWTLISSEPWNVWLSDWMAVYIFLNMLLNENESKKHTFKNMNITRLMSVSMEYF